MRHLAISWGLPPVCELTPGECFIPGIGQPAGLRVEQVQSWKTILSTVPLCLKDYSGWSICHYRFWLLAGADDGLYGSSGTKTGAKAWANHQMNISRVHSNQ
jgi:hypothetical protein